MKPQRSDDIFCFHSEHLYCKMIRGRYMSFGAVYIICYPCVAARHQSHIAICNHFTRIIAAPVAHYKPLPNSTCLEIYDLQIRLIYLLADLCLILCYVTVLTTNKIGYV